MVETVEALQLNVNGAIIVLGIILFAFSMGKVEHVRQTSKDSRTDRN